MAQPKVSKEALKAIAAMSGLDLSDERLEDLLPEVGRVVEGLAALEALDLEGVEPATVFRADG